MHEYKIANFPETLDHIPYCMTGHKAIPSSIYVSYISRISVLNFTQITLYCLFTQFMRFTLACAKYTNYAKFECNPLFWVLIQHILR